MNNPFLKYQKEVKDTNRATYLQKDFRLFEMGTMIHPEILEAFSGNELKKILEKQFEILVKMYHPDSPFKIKNKEMLSQHLLQAQKVLKALDGSECKNQLGEFLSDTLTNKISNLLLETGKNNYIKNKFFEMRIYDYLHFRLLIGRGTLISPIIDNRSFVVQENEKQEPLSSLYDWHKIITDERIRLKSLKNNEVEINSTLKKLPIYFYYDSLNEIEQTKDVFNEIINEKTEKELFKLFYFLMGYLDYIYSLNKRENEESYDNILLISEFYLTQGYQAFIGITLDEKLQAHFYSWLFKHRKNIIFQQENALSIVNSELSCLDQIKEILQNPIMFTSLMHPLLEKNLTHNEKLFILAKYLKLLVVELHPDTDEKNLFPERQVLQQRIQKFYNIVINEFKKNSQLFEFFIQGVENESYQRSIFRRAQKEVFRNTEVVSSPTKRDEEKFEMQLKPALLIIQNNEARLKGILEKKSISYS